MKSSILAACVAGMFAVGASAEITFSFASDDNADGPTFQDLDITTLPDVTEGTTPADISGQVEVVLTIDTNGDLAGGTSAIDAIFSFSGTFNAYGAFTLPFSGNTLHAWEMDGVYAFHRAADGELIKSVAFENAVFTSSAPSGAAIGLGAAIEGSSDIGTIVVTTGAASPVSNIEISSFAFGLSPRAVADGGSVNVAVLKDFPELDGFPRLAEHWTAEGSYQASGIPEPTAMVLFGSGLVGLVVSRRRRSA